MRTLDPLDHIRRNPGMYLPGGNVDPSHLASRLSYDALTLGATRTLVVHRDAWWTVAADRDWLADGSRVLEDLFQNVVPFPEAGVNAMRSEVLLGAFADEILTWDRQIAMVLKGVVPNPPAVQSLLGDTDQWARTIAFRLEPVRLREAQARASTS